VKKILKYSFIKTLTKCKINTGCDIKHDIKSYGQLDGLDNQAIPSHVTASVNCSSHSLLISFRFYYLVIHLVIIAQTPFCVRLSTGVFVHRQRIIGEDVCRLPCPLQKYRAQRCIVHRPTSHTARCPKSELLQRSLLC
jgi:hypothetical protein